jgi:hypothetical protein
MEDPEISPHSYRQLILDKDAKIYIREKTACSTNGIGETGYPHVED